MVHRCAGRGREEAGKATHGGDGARIDEMWRVEEDEKLFKVPDVSAHHFLDGRQLEVLLIPFFPLNTLNPSWWLLISPLSWLRLFPRWLSG